jgi:hypothetical protein
VVGDQGNENDTLPEAEVLRGMAGVDGIHLLKRDRTPDGSRVRRPAGPGASS